VPKKRAFSSEEEVVSAPAANASSEDIFKIGSVGKTAAQNRIRSAVSLEEEDIFGFGPGAEVPRKQNTAKPSRSIFINEEEEKPTNILECEGSVPLQKGDKQHTLVPTLKSANQTSAAETTLVNSTHTGTSTATYNRAHPELDSTGFIGKVGATHIQVNTVRTVYTR